MEAALFDESLLPYELNTRVQSELRDGERLLWVGQPRPGRVARAGLGIMLFGIPFTAFSVFWIAAASGLLFDMGDAPGAVRWFMPLFGLPFLLIGVGMLSAPYWLRRRARRTCYALTDQRAITWEAGMFGAVEVRSFEPKELTKLRRVEYRNGEGDLVFEEMVTLGRDSDGDATTHTRRYGFMGIPHVRRIEELLRKALLEDLTETADR